MSLYGSFALPSSQRGNDISRALDQFQKSAVDETERIREFLAMSPAVRNTDLVKRDIEAAEGYRVRILKTVPAFQGLNFDQLRSAADSLDEMLYKKGDVIIEQDTVGDCVR